jgi:hypothetical protein
MEEYQKVLQVDPDDKKVQDLLREQSFKKSAEASSRAMGRKVQRNILHCYLPKSLLLPEN